jgi:hypothetical protein
VRSPRERGFFSFPAMQAGNEKGAGSHGARRHLLRMERKKFHLTFPLVSCKLISVIGDANVLA